MSNYNNLQADDTMVVNNGSSSYSVTVENVASGQNLQETDVFLVNRGDKSYSVTKQQLSEEIGARGEIEAPVVVITPPNGAGLAGQDVNPSAEGITAVTDTTIAGPVWSDSFSCDKPQNDGKELTNAFDGSLTTLCNEQVGGATYTFVAPLSGSYEIYMYSNGGRELKVDGVKVADVPVTNDGQQTWYTIGTVTAGQTITIEGAAGGSFIYAWRVDNQILVDSADVSAIKLTYTTNNNLNLLADGQAMTQQPAYTPVTDTISAVDPNNITFNFAVWNSNSGTGPFETNKNIAIGASFTQDYTGQAYAANPGPISSANTIIWRTTNGEFITNLEYVLVQTATQTPGRAVWTSPDGIVWTHYLKGSQGAGTHIVEGTHQYICFHGGPANQTTEIPTQTKSNPILTFNSNKDLANFRVGDIAKAVASNNPAWNETQIWSTKTSGAKFYSSADSVTPITDSSIMFNGETGTPYLVVQGGSGVATTTVNLTGVTKLRAFTYYPSGSPDNASDVFYVNGSVVTPISKVQANWTELPVPGDGNLNSFGFTAENNTSGGNYVYISAWEINDKILVDPVNQIKIISTDDIANNKLTVDGGTWSNGETITGSAYAGKGKYVSHTSTELELTNFTSRWCVDDQGVGLAAQSDDIYTSENPGWDGLEFQSANGADESTAFSGEGCTLRDIKWTLESSSGDQNGPWENTTEYPLTVAYAVGDEVSPWSGPADDLLPNTYYRVKVQYIADSGADPITSEWNVFKTQGSEKPQVKLSGLRFDGNRETLLVRSRSSAGGYPWTYSVWLKNTLGTSFDSFLESNPEKNNFSREQFRVNSGGTGIARVTNGTVSGQWNSVVTNNQWYHIVIVATDSTTRQLYVNGVDQGTLSGLTAATKGIAESAGNLYIGTGYSGTADNEKEPYQGYMSDVYFIDGQVLDASAFGKDYAGLWGPLPSETVLNNITRSESPYDQRPNMDEKWSDTVTANATYLQDATLGFDGDLSTNLELKGNDSEDKSALTIPGPFTNVTSLELLGRVVGTSGNSYTVSGNGFETFTWPNMGAAPINIPLTSSTIYDIKIEANDDSSGVRLAYIKINGRILVDGPADNSQNWSAGTVTGDYETNGWHLAFDGSTTTSPFKTNQSVGDDTTPTLSTLTFTSPIPFNTEVSIYNSTSPKEKENIIINGISLGTTQVVGGWEDLTARLNNAGITQIESMSMGDTTGDLTNMIFNAIRVDGKILIDAGPEWNTSQVWSNSLTCTTNSNAGFRDATDPVTNAFDGISSTMATTVNGANPTQLVLDLGQDYPSGTTIEASVSWNGDTATLKTSTSSDISSVVNTDEQTSGANYIAVHRLTASGSFRYIAFERNNTAHGLGQVKINGKILVDAGSFGNNGFYLPFDPAATGANYGNSITRSGAGTVVAGTSESMFNGELLSGGLIVSTGTITETFGTPLPTGNYEPVLAINGGIENVVFNLQDSSTVTWTITDAPGGITAGSPAIYASKEVSSPVVSITRTAVSGVGIKSFIVDGAQLVDHNSIGVDASGQDNHFHDQNFAVAGNTDEAWSLLTTATNITNGSIANIYNGFNEASGITGSYIAVTSGNIKLTHTFTNVTSFLLCESHSGSYTIRFNDDPATDQTVSTPDNTVNKDVSITAPATINSVEFFGGVKIYISEIKINGKVLVDKNIQDTVLDTPVKDYAVISSSGADNGGILPRNGNLEFTHPVANFKSARATVTMDSGKYYFEMTKGTTLTMLGIARPTDALDSHLGSSTDRGIGFGNNATYKDGVQIDGPAHAVGDVLMCAFNADTGNLWFGLNGTWLDTNNTSGLTGDPATGANPRYTGLTETTWKPAVTGYNNSIASVVNFGQQPFVYEPPTGYEGIYQELEEYQVAGGYFYDEVNQQAVRGSDLRKRFGISSADSRLGIYDLTEVPGYQVIGYEKTGDKYQALRDYTLEVRTAQAETTAVTAELTEAQATITLQRQMIIRAACAWVVGKVYEAGDIIIFNGHVFEALTSTTATADNDPGDAAGNWKYLGLEEDAAPTTINGYYPLFTTEEAANEAGNGSSHAHTFDGVTYWMPDAGTTIYHGTYTGYSY